MAFGTFERMVAFRYLRARRQEGFVSVIAIFSLLGIALGVATLIIVMSVMNGFRAEFVGRIIGINGHLAVIGSGGAITNFDELDAKMNSVAKERMNSRTADAFTDRIFALDNRRFYKGVAEGSPGRDSVPSDA